MSFRKYIVQKITMRLRSGREYNFFQDKSERSTSRSTIIEEEEPEELFQKNMLKKIMLKIPEINPTFGAQCYRVLSYAVYTLSNLLGIFGGAYSLLCRRRENRSKYPKM